jgi:protein TonB
LIRQVSPKYTADAMRARVQGSALLALIVQPDGTVTDIRISRSLDSSFGLDQEAIKAAREWRFAPCLRLGQPVSCDITIEMTFTLR